MSRAATSQIQYAQAQGRPEKRSAPKHTAILSAATDVFMREGYARASVDAIARAANVGKQTVYGHFGDKQRLFLAVVRHAHDSNALDPAEVITDSGNPAIDLTAAAKRIIHAVTTPEVAALHRLTVAELTHHPELQRSWRDDGEIGNIIDTIAKYLANQDLNGSLAISAPKTTARQFVMLASAEAQVRSLRGIHPLATQEIGEIAHDTADLIIRAHSPR
ncbi:TetR/AcrR family transcriptional regulator [Paramicrobacterium chengjingii]|uniref:TetR/AcrR family transcriptional regulator n=1 Tax=Paramicrobacterium chengjingii TaxID=2769067 RepID=UPI001AB030C5|nr:TetR/AcrR family transcriptional regulator [Microbacterium chengjingii]